ncbi:hypothetical protein, partial [Burkholderia ubonensis]|uniref:hypothetical protein n=1 Tax=Burkholderia ubonensis TaxID=101571 RepID=UPI001E5A1266
HASFASKQILQPKRDRVSGHAGASPATWMASFLTNRITSSNHPENRNRLRLKLSRAVRT